VEILKPKGFKERVRSEAPFASASWRMENGEGWATFCYFHGTANIFNVRGNKIIK